LGSSKITLPAHKSGPKKYHFIPNALARTRKFAGARGYLLATFAAG
jgi:hypothetical protein